MFGFHLYLAAIALFSLLLFGTSGCERECPECKECPSGTEAKPVDTQNPYQRVEGDGFVAELPPGHQSAFTDKEAESRAKQLVQFVKLGYGDDFKLMTRSLKFRTGNLSTKEAQLVVSLIKSYNAFDGEKVAKVIERFADRVESWEFGRENSPVLYMTLPYHTEFPNRVPPEVHQKTIKDLKRALLEELQADEFGPAYPEIGDNYLRAWWD